MSSSPLTRTANSTSRVKRTSARTETAKPPTSANCRPREPSSWAMAPSARSIGVSAVIGYQPSLEHHLKLVFGGARVLLSQGAALEPETCLHELERLAQLVCGCFGSRQLDVALFQRVHERILPCTRHAGVGTRGMKLLDDRRLVDLLHRSPTCERVRIRAAVAVRRDAEGSVAGQPMHTSRDRAAP